MIHIDCRNIILPKYNIFYCFRAFNVKILVGFNNWEFLHDYIYHVQFNILCSGILCLAFKILNVSDESGYGDFGDISLEVLNTCMRSSTHLFLLIDEIDCAFVTRTCVYRILSRSILDSPKAHIAKWKIHYFFRMECSACFAILLPSTCGKTSTTIFLSNFCAIIIREILNFMLNDYYI